jgi:outer membrane receptor protein involved in Fe transport
VDLAATWRHINEVKNEGTRSDDALHVDDIPPQDQKLAARDYLDLAAQWAFSKRLTFRGGVNNILDKDPPLVSNTLAGPNIFGNGNTFPQLYDSLGRRFFVGLTFSL